MSLTRALPCLGGAFLYIEQEKWVRWSAWRSVPEGYTREMAHPLAHRQLTIVVGVIERDGKFLALRRVDDEPRWHHKWELPGGRIGVDETPQSAIQRSIREDVGLEISEPELLGVYTDYWEFPDFTQQTFLIVYRADAKHGDVRLNPEKNDDFKWVTIDEFFVFPDRVGGSGDALTELYAPFVRVPVRRTTDAGA